MSGESERTRNIETHLEQPAGSISSACPAVSETQRLENLVLNVFVGDLSGAVEAPGLPLNGTV